MDLPSSQKPKSFSEIVSEAKSEIPPAPDLRFSIRNRLSQVEDSERSWILLLIDSAMSIRVRVGFGIAFATLMATSYWELSRPEPVPQPRIPSFVIERFFNV